jgi:hypothetical protein
MIKIIRAYYRGTYPTEKDMIDEMEAFSAVLKK